MPGIIRTSVHTQSEQIRVLADVDVAQLLRDIGEASVSTSPVELFRLCLEAQRFLADVQIGSAPATTTEESALLASFHAMNGEGRNRLVSFSRHLQTRFPRLRAALALVRSNERGGTV